jgi:hypothetical protein
LFYHYDLSEQEARGILAATRVAVPSAAKP